MFAWYQGSNTTLITTLLDWPSVFADLHGLDDAAVSHLVVPSTQRLQVRNADKEELSPIASVFDPMVHDVSKNDAAFG